jgi:hypothetical protein
MEAQKIYEFNFILRFQAYPTLDDRVHHWVATLTSPGQHRPVMVHHREGKGYLHIPPLVRNPGERAKKDSGYLAKLKTS